MPEDDYMNTPSVLDAAKNIVRGDRAKAYGHPRINMQRIADAWACVLGHPVSPREVALCMAVLKIIREQTGTGCVEDNYIDAAGYIDIAWMVR